MFILDPTARAFCASAACRDGHRTTMSLSAMLRGEPLLVWFVGLLLLAQAAAECVRRRTPAALVELPIRHPALHGLLVGARSLMVGLIRFAAS